jgi:hypothetical protein
MKRNDLRLWHKAPVRKPGRGLHIVTWLALALGPAGLHAQGFDSGSNGSYGPINVSSGTVTLNVPPDGIFHCTTITITGGTLRFNRNPLNTPVYLLAQGDISIGPGQIDVSGGAGTPVLGGAGGPGGFDGGMPGNGPSPPGDGQGPGAGRAGDGTTGESGAGGGAYGARPALLTANDGLTYGSALLLPMLGGSGGGGTATSGGGGGGGAILLASNTRVVLNLARVIRANGGGTVPNPGSGGAIRIVAPVISGGGSVDVLTNNHSGAGRVRFDLIDRSSFDIQVEPASAGSIGAHLVVFPPAVPRLDLIEVAGQAIAEGAADPVQVLLPFGSSPDRTVRVQARGFTGIVPIDLVLTPESGGRIVYPAQIDMSSGNPAQVTVNVQFPINTVTRVTAWTR